MPDPRFGGTDRPTDILDDSGRWLAEHFGWRWVKSDAMLRSGLDGKFVAWGSNRGGILAQTAPQLFDLPRQHSDLRLRRFKLGVPGG